jgi:DNA-binding PadR family transcriptional regulator
MPPTFKPQVASPLALAVLGTLAARPMHPYEIASTMRRVGLEYSIKLNYGSLYTVVESLERRGLIIARETIQEGRRPPRTVYAISEAGRAELHEWLRQLIREPAKEYTQFAAGLCFLAQIPPDEAAQLLEMRAAQLEQQVADLRSGIQTELDKGRNPLFFVEHEHAQVLLQAELDWIRGLVRRITDNEVAFITRGGDGSSLVWYDGRTAPMEGPGDALTREAP